MSNTVIKIEHLSKMYKLGVINNGTLFQDIQSWLALKQGKEDPHSKIGDNKYLESDSDFWALKDVTFDIKQGDRVGIIGKNGAGKSTLLKVLSRITAPTEGAIKIRGKISSLLEVGTGFHGELTGRENIYLNGAILGMKKREIDRKLDEIIDFSGIERHIDTPVKRYSSGMYVRLAFAVAAHLDSDILIADEVLAVGDAEFQKKALGKMNDLSAKQSRTVLFVSHNMAAVKALCNKGVILEKGRLKFTSDNIDEAIGKYLGEKNNNEKNNDGWKNLSNSHSIKEYANIFQSIKISNSKNEPADTFQIKESLLVEVNLKNTEMYPEADYCIAIHSQYGQWLMSFATWMFSCTHINNPKKIFLKIDSLRFAPGAYNIYLSATDHLGQKYLDQILYAEMFYISETDIFHNGKSYTSNEGIIIPDGNFYME